jgi:hypothetical protein
MYGICLGFVKLSTVTFYLQLPFVGVFKNFLYGVAVLIVFQTVILALVPALRCGFTDYVWQEAGRLGSTKACLDWKAWSYSISVLNLATDILVLLLPMKMVMNLKLPIRRKIGLYLLFCMGFL